MARLLFVLPSSLGLEPNQKVRVDTASGSVTPADIRSTGGGPSIEGSIVHAGPSGELPRILGPNDDTATLYLKPLTSAGAETGARATVTGDDPNEPATPFGGGAASAVALCTHDNVAVANGGALSFGAAQAQGPPLLDMTDPTNPKVLEDGVYAITITTLHSAAGTGYYVDVSAGFDTADQWWTVDDSYWKASGAFAYTTQGSMTLKLAAGSGLSAYVSHNAPGPIEISASAMVTKLA